ncbi:hypothetical protein QBC47DRAFT_388862 [Echria macrotheca]|uniref:Secreted protein n=1 Tax=Echria macrotheca TaxID=438768 RepID=A0AAJ0F6N7_9PEZI|nr:hypothetical protein QBC47DRAFT_388862 [Echria macrotheca]
MDERGFYFLLLCLFIWHFTASLPSPTSSETRPRRGPLSFFPFPIRISLHEALLTSRSAHLELYITLCCPPEARHQPICVLHPPSPPPSSSLFPDSFPVSYQSCRLLDSSSNEPPPLFLSMRGHPRPESRPIAPSRAPTR